MATKSDEKSDGAISIYAELLANIRQVSVKVTLPTTANESTTAAIIEDGLKLRVDHDGQTKEVVLPSKVSLLPSLPVSKSASYEVAWRLPLPPSNNHNGRFVAESQAVPWTATDLKTGSNISCRECKTGIVNSNTITSWKDLPSENWAEMMEFWHCHKPVEHDKHDGNDENDEHLTKRGYGASNAIAAQPGIGFVDIASFMLWELDCSNLSYISDTNGASHDTGAAATGDSSSKFLSITCKSCQSAIGTWKVLNASVNLFKWKVEVESLSNTFSPSSIDCLVAMITSTISKTGSSKSIIMPHASTTNQATPLHIWVLNNNVVYTSSSLAEKRTALKILYKDIGHDEAMKLLESMTGDAQDIVFAQQAIEEARRCLEQSTAILPPSERAFQGWKVGLLERWDATI